MIGRLRGMIVEKHPPHLLLDVNGVSYEIEAPMTTFYQLPEINQPVSLYTHLTIREDAHLLFGFATENERRLFRDLIKVNGVGPKVALGILSGMEAEQFIRCVQDGSVTRLTSIPGIGKKTAERLIIEMRDRLKGWGNVIPASGSAVSTSTPTDASADAVSALISLGYRPNDASRYVLAVARDGMSSEQLIREALKSLAKA